MKTSVAVLIAVGVLWTVSDVEGHSNGAPKNHKVCKAMRPRHGGALPQTVTSPFIVTASKDKVAINTAVEVTLTSTGNSTPFKGFLLQTRGTPSLITKPIGYFEIENADLSKPLSCYNTNDTVTHSNPIEKRSISFKWIPPRDLKGTVYLQATFVQIFPIYWIHINHKVVIGSSGRVNSKWMEPYPPDETDDLHKYLKHHKYNQIVHKFYEGCGSTKKCFGMPEGCVSTSSCDAVMSVSERNLKFVFEMMGKVSDYVALRLSEMNDLSKNSVTECLLINNVVQLYHSPKYSMEGPLQHDNTSSNVILLNSSYIEGIIYCKFSRNKTTDFNGYRFDMKESKYVLTLAAGNMKKSENNELMSFENIKFKSSQNFMNLSEVNENVITNRRSNLTTKDSFNFGSWILKFFKYFAHTI